MKAKSQICECCNQYIPFRVTIENAHGEEWKYVRKVPGKKWADMYRQRLPTMDNATWYVRNDYR